METEAGMRRELDAEGLGAQVAVKRAVDADDDANWWPLVMVIAGLFITIGLFIIGLAPTWAILAGGVALSAVVAAFALLWLVLRPRPRPH